MKFEPSGRAVPAVKADKPFCGADTNLVDWNWEDFKYQANPDGSYSLYSVGVDGVDNEGDTSVSPGEKPFWYSRDMVWPYCR